MTTPPAVAPEAAWNRMTRLHMDLDRLTRRLLERQAGMDVSLPPPDFSHPQTAFFATTVWTSAWYKEAWSVSHGWLESQAKALGHTVPDAKFVHVLGRLRTFLVHHVDRSRPKDGKTEKTCVEWFEAACGSAVPHAADEWHECLARLLAQNEAHTQFVFDTAKSVERSADRDTLVDQWRSVLERRDYPRYQRSLQEAAGDLGLERLDDRQLNVIHDQYRARWEKAISQLPHEADFTSAMRLMAEWALLADTGRSLAVGAADVIRTLGLPPGVKVAQALRLAQLLHEIHPDDTTDELLRRLSWHWKGLFTPM
ncbi:hypothetical protein [Streptomyces longwoodensis]|uniref:hypothetical protein n=1 Tax=Streptomyces longwoodensis TaxID=68231 RepID=UPI003402626B